MRTPTHDDGNLLCPSCPLKTHDLLGSSSTERVTRGAAVVLWLWLTAVLMGCGGWATDGPPPASIRYEAERVSFVYPNDWSVVSQQGRNEGLFMGIHELFGAGSARVFVTVYDAQAPFAAEDVAAMHLNALPYELAALPVTETGRAAVSAQVGGRPVTGVSVRFTVPVAEDPRAHTVQAFTWKTERRTAAVITQVADADADRARAGLAMVLESLRVH